MANAADPSDMVHGVHGALNPPLAALWELGEAPWRRVQDAAAALGGALHHEVPALLDAAQGDLAAAVEPQGVRLRPVPDPGADLPGFLRDLEALQTAADGEPGFDAVWAWARRVVDQRLEDARRRADELGTALQEPPTDPPRSVVAVERRRVAAENAVQALAWAVDDLALAHRDVARDAGLDAPRQLGRNLSAGEALEAARRGNLLGSPDARRHAQRAVEAAVRSALAELDLSLPFRDLLRAVDRAGVELPVPASVLAGLEDRLRSAGLSRALAGRLLTHAVVEVAEVVVGRVGSIHLDADAREQLSRAMSEL